LDSPVHRDHQEIPELRDSQVQLEVLDSRDLRAVLDQVVRWEELGLRGKSESLEHLERQAFQVHRDPMDSKAVQGLQEL